MKHNKKSSATRRNFLKTAAASVACPYIITSTALGAEGRAPASDRVVMGGIGIGNQGSGDQGAYLGRGDVQYVAACDVKKSKREESKNRINGHYKNNDCKLYSDFRELLARPDIDAVHVATPDHWHAIVVVEACRHGKDVYCQKPESRTIREGRLMVEAARRYSRVVSGGSQRVLDDYGGVAADCWSGKLGKVMEIYVECGGPSKPCNLPGQPVPDDIDWDMWLGPAPWQPYHEDRVSGSYDIASGHCWRAWSDFSGGGMTDWGAHKFGGAMFAGNVRDQGPIEIIPPDGKDHKYLTYVFANGLKIYHSRGRPNTNVTPVPNPSESIVGKQIPRYKGEGGIYGDFIYCVKHRSEKPFRDIELAHRTATVCHLGNIAYELKRPLKWDAKKEEFPDDDEANRFLDRAKREPWSLS
ncbi:MAG TPA: Gfo/Idh/MocA family oxidoreductase [Pirellulales bacterium]